LGPDEMNYFDDSLPTFVELLSEQLGAAAVEQGLFSRDTAGRLAFFSAVELSDTVINRLSKLALKHLGQYARADRPIASRSDFGVDALFAENALKFRVGLHSLRMLDRRLVGADWLRPPVEVNRTPPRFVFASLKGGVGRTTALSIVAADLASQGKKVLIVDLDLEAPGIGSMLLDEGTTPEFGMIDALVEIGLQKLSDIFMADLVGPSRLSDRKGKIDVIPAFGQRSLNNTGEILAKISRAYAERINVDGTTSTFLDKVAEIVDHFSHVGRYDAILVDARAGLHETTASALLGLGAHVFLFGLDEPQTFHGYEALFSNLVRIDAIGAAKSEWITTISMVQGKAPEGKEDRSSFSAKCDLLFKKTGFTPARTKLNAVPLPAEPFNDVPWEEDSKISDDELKDSQRVEEALYVLYNNEYHLFDPQNRTQLMTGAVYSEPYKVLLQKVAAVMDQPVGEKF
jgi:MinD-like ATPase involved in chromosome partitioning or flagellar assembly